MECFKCSADECQGLSKQICYSVLWKSLYLQCLESNLAIDAERFSLAKTKRKLSNVMKLVTDFNSMISEVTEIHSEDTLGNAGNMQTHENVSTAASCLNCGTVCNYVERSEKTQSDIELTEFAQSSDKMEEIPHAGKQDNIIAADITKNTVNVFESISGNSDKECVTFVHSKKQCVYPSSYAQRKQVFKCSLCRRKGHMAKYCWSVSDRKSHNFKTSPRRYEVYSVRRSNHRRYNRHVP